MTTTGLVNGAVHNGHVTGGSSLVAAPARVRVGDLEMPQAWGVPAISPIPARSAGRAGTGLDVEVGALPGEDPEPDLEQDGVLPPAGRDLAVLVGVVGTAAVAEAGWNVGQACLELLHLPVPLAVMFPLVLESAASSCALQDLRDRRRGVRSRALAAGTYLGLAVSAAVNGAVGWAANGPAGLLEILPPVVFGALIHIHGSRSERAWRSRAKTRRGWRRAQLQKARIESVAEVLPLLTGDDEDGKATVALLRRRLDTDTLTPAEALIAAGWWQRHTRPDMTPSRIRRLETVAATVWPDGAPSAPQRTTGASRAGTTTASRPAASGPAASGPAASGPAASGPDDLDQAPELRTATDHEIQAAISQVWSQNPRAGERPIGKHLRAGGLTASSARIRPLLEQARAELAAAADLAGAGGDDA